RRLQARKSHPKPGITKRTPRARRRPPALLACPTLELPNELPPGFGEWRPRHAIRACPAALSPFQLPEIVALCCAMLRYSSPRARPCRRTPAAEEAKLRNELQFWTT